MLTRKDSFKKYTLRAYTFQVPFSQLNDSKNIFLYLKRQYIFFIFFDTPTICLFGSG